VAGVADLRQGAARSTEALRSGKARAVLEALVRTSHEPSPEAEAGMAESPAWVSAGSGR
jgi:hypothetical protein